MSLDVLFYINIIKYLLNSTYRRDAHLSKNIGNDTQNEASAHPRNSFCCLYQFYGNGVIVVVFMWYFLDTILSYYHRRPASNL